MLLAGSSGSWRAALHPVATVEGSEEQAATVGTMMAPAIRRRAKVRGLMSRRRRVDGPHHYRAIVGQDLKPEGGEVGEEHGPGAIAVVDDVADPHRR